MSRHEFKVGSVVRLSGIKCHGPAHIYRDGKNQLGCVINIGWRNILVRWGKGGGIDWWYNPADLNLASIFYAETDRKGLVI